MISSKSHLLETYLCTPAASLREDSRASSMTTESSSADTQMRFLGDGEALCVPGGSGLPFSKSMDSLLPNGASQIEQKLHLRNRWLWEENKRLQEELKQLRSQASSSSSHSKTESWRPGSQNHDVLNELLKAQSKRQGSVADAISMLGQATKEHVLTFGPHAIRHMAVQLLLWTFHLEEGQKNGLGQPIRLNFYLPGADPELFVKAKDWVGDMHVEGKGFQESAQNLIDDHLSKDQPVEAPSEYNSAVLAQMMMRYPEVKDFCSFSADIVEKQTKPLSQLTTCII